MTQIDPNNPMPLFTFVPASPFLFHSNCSRFQLYPRRGVKEGNVRISTSNNTCFIRRCSTFLPCCQVIAEAFKTFHALADLEVV